MQTFIIFVVACYGFALPLAYYLALKTTVGFVGLWIGLALGLLVLDILLIVLLSTRSWKRLISTSSKDNSNAE